jgi:hypothetical protein
MNLAQMSKSMSDYINRKSMLIKYLCTVKKVLPTANALTSLHLIQFFTPDYY